MKSFLHVGCGQKRKGQTTRGFATDDWREVRFDIDEAVQPDIVGTIADMTAVDSESFDAVFSSHNIEHLFPHEVVPALREFRRVLKPDGFAVVTCPDLQSVARLIAEDKLIEPAYTSPAGPISPLDILYGHRASLARGQHYMAHKTGFTESSLRRCFAEAGYATIGSMKREGPSFDLWIIGTRAVMDEAGLRAIAMDHFPLRAR